MQYVLDTSICIYIAKKKPPQVAGRLAKLSPGSVGMSFITLGELLYGAMRSQQADASLSRLHELSELMPALSAHPELPRHYAEIRADLAAKRLPIGNNDLWTAAHVRAQDMILVSNNLREFERVPGLRLENWVAS